MPCPQTLIFMPSSPSKHHTVNLWVSYVKISIKVNGIYEIPGVKSIAKLERDTGDLSVIFSKGGNIQAYRCQRFGSKSKVGDRNSKMASCLERQVLRGGVHEMKLKYVWYNGLDAVLLEKPRIGKNSASKIFRWGRLRTSRIKYIGCDEQSQYTGVGRISHRCKFYDKLLIVRRRKTWWTEALEQKSTHHGLNGQIELVDLGGR